MSGAWFHHSPSFDEAIVPSGNSHKEVFQCQFQLATIFAFDLFFEISKASFLQLGDSARRSAIATSDSWTVTSGDLSWHFSEPAKQRSSALSKRLGFIKEILRHNGHG